MLMRIFGLDFTSAPHPRKPITCAEGTFDGQMLSVQKVTALSGFAAFEAFLRRPGPWIAGLDFPFGQPLTLLQYLHWGATWAEYVGHVAQLGLGEFAAALTAYRRAHPPGAKQPLRLTDARAHARSPMMWYGVPVGRMFFQGAPRLLAAGVQVAPCRMNGDRRVAVEAYPALVARKWIGARSYKSDTRRKQTPAHAAARQALVQGLRAACTQHYGFALALSDTLAAQLIADPAADTLDAVLCAVQAAWACTQPNYGVPAQCHPAEGWIVDPDTADDSARP